MLSRSQSHHARRLSAYRWDAFAQESTSYVANGLNQYTQINGLTVAYDANGNLTDDGLNTYIYDVENRLVEMRFKTAPGGCPAGTNVLAARLFYDPLGRLYKTENYTCGALSDERIYLHDGDALVAEFNTSGAVLQRHIHGPAQGVDDPLVSYESPWASFVFARFLQSDPRGSIVYSSTYTDGARVVNSYDAYGRPGQSNSGRFQYTGQVWLPELGMYYYKARIYSPQLGRFMQTDPIGYEGGNNLYSYANADPINLVDQTGLAPGDIFESFEAAAQDWAQYVQSDTGLDSDGGQIEIESREYASLVISRIDSEGNKSFTYTQPDRGTRDNFTITAGEDDFAAAEGFLHNHNGEGRVATASEADRIGRASVRSARRGTSADEGARGRADTQAARVIARRSDRVDGQSVRAGILGPRQRLPNDRGIGRLMRYFIGRNLRADE